MATCPYCLKRRRLAESGERVVIHGKTYFALVWWINGHGDCNPVLVGTSTEVALAATGLPMIDSFQFDHFFLSNFFPAVVALDGVEYPSVEQAYQAAKFTNERERCFVRACKTPGAAKRLAYNPMFAHLVRADWESAKLDVMRRLLDQKFSQPELRDQLLATRPALLVEGNTWGDIFWGICQGVGENHLGQMLMEIRDE